MNIIKYFSLLIILLELSAEDWKHFQGPNGDGISYEKGLKSIQLNQIWKTNINIGFSSVSVSEGILYSMGNQNESDIVYALNAKNGKIIWQYKYPCKLAPDLYAGGPSVTPTIDEGKVFTLSREGHFFCFDAKTGRVLWQKHCSEFGAIPPRWGYAGSPTILEEKVLVNVGDHGAAFNKATGKIIWSSKGDNAGYASIIPYSQTQALMFSGDSLLNISIETGSVNWSQKFSAHHQINAAAPILVDKKVLISTGYGSGRAGLYDISKKQPKLVWETHALKAQFTNPIYLKGYFYAVTGNTNRRCKLICMEAKSGKVTWEKQVEFGSLRATEDQLYFLDQKGLLSVFEVNPKSYREISSKQILNQKCWTPPTISHGVLYARNSRGELVAIDLK